MISFKVSVHRVLMQHLTSMLVWLPVQLNVTPCGAFALPPWCGEAPCGNHELRCACTDTISGMEVLTDDFLESRAGETSSIS